MFELPEFTTLAKQMNETLKGKRIEEGRLGNSPHKFVWYNRKPDEFAKLTKGKIIGAARAKGKWLFVAVEPGYLLVFGECGGKILYHPADTQPPSKYHLLIHFDDGASLSAMTQMWGAMELYEKGKERARQYIKDMRTTPLEPGFTFAYFSKLIDEVIQVEKTSAKGLLTQNQLIPGLGNAIAQDILFRARLSPKHPIDDLTKSERRQLYNAIVKTVKQVIAKGGRYDEFDLYDQPGKYVRLMDKHAVERPCPECGRRI
ncbi:MAG: DNA-formamidopyrimidine glycosylase family protein, partial [Chloroflexota bacterium]